MTVTKTNVTFLMVAWKAAGCNPIMVVPMTYGFVYFLLCLVPVQASILTLADCKLEHPSSYRLRVDTGTCASHSEAQLEYTSELRTRNHVTMSPI